MKNNNSIDVFQNMPVPKAVLKNIIPSIVSMIMVLVYNLADTFFILVRLKMHIWLQQFR